MLFVFFCGALCSAASLAGYVSAAEEKGFATTVVVPDTSPFTADNGRDLSRMREAIAQESERFARANGRQPELSFFAFSGGAKFAARIAQDTGVEGLFLLDPVDGPPPNSRPSDRFPVYLDQVDASWRTVGGAAGVAREPAALRIVSTELGERRGFTGTPCVTPAYGPRLFAERLGALASEGVEIADAGHLDVLFRDAGLLGSVCPRGGNREAARSSALGEFKDFLAQLD
jgi:hypothetical protein